MPFTNSMIDGDPAAPILIIVTAPGREELTRNRPLIGGAGKLLWAMTQRAGFSRTDCYILSTIGEWPAKADGNPSQEQLERYWETFDDALRLSHARVVVCLGGASFNRLTGILDADARAKRRSGIEKWRGYLVGRDECFPLTHRVSRYEVYKTSTKLHKKGDPKLVKHRVVELPPLPASVEWIIPTLHPAGVMRSGLSTIPALAADIQRVKRALDGKLNLISFDYKTEPFELPADADFSIDIETRRPVAGLDSDIIVRVGVAHGIDVWTREWDSTAKAAVATLLASPREKVMHNAPFDTTRLEAEGLEVANPIFDTMLCAAALQPDLYKGLNSVAPLYLDVRRWKHESDSDPEYYNAADNVYQYALKQVMVAVLKQTGQYDWFTKIIMPGARELMRMSTIGLKLDVAKRKVWINELVIRQQQYLQAFIERSGGVDPNSHKQVHAYLYDSDLLPKAYGKYGGFTADAGTLRELRSYILMQPESSRLTSMDGAIESLIAYREVDKLLSTYTKYPLSEDGCVHPSYLPAAKDDEDEAGKGLAGTFRPTTKHPNVQNQPQEARKLYICHTLGHEFSEADYSQLELRIAATLANDKVLLEALKGDVHAATMALLRCDRVRAKNVMYGSLYGAGPRKLAKVLRAKGFPITEKEARELQDALAKAYPALWAWRQHVIQQVSKTYELTTPFGGKRYFYQGRKQAPAALDFLPQGTAAHIMWSILPALGTAMRSLGGLLVTETHDSTLNEGHPAKRKKIHEAIRDVMEQEWPQIAPGFRVPVNIKVGWNWGELHEVS